MSGPFYSEVYGPLGTYQIGVLPFTGLAGKASLNVPTVLAGSEVFVMYIGEKLTLPDTIFVKHESPTIVRPATQTYPRPPGTRIPT